MTLTQDFFIQTTEVTQAQWEAVMGSNPSQYTNCGPDCPVDHVSWNQIAQFIEQLEMKFDGAYKCRLPTEAQWEYAARAGTSTDYYEGDMTFDKSDALIAGDLEGSECNNEPNLYAAGWYCYNSRVDYEGCQHHFEYCCDQDPDMENPLISCNGPHPVKRKIGNAFGLYDMHGNVYEWCADWHGVYTAEPRIDPTGPSDGTEKVVRGGSWSSYPGYCRSAARESWNPDREMGDIGFRLVCSQR